MTSALDPHRPVAIFWSTGRYTLQAAVYRNRREDQNSVNATVGGFLPACEQIATDRPLSKMRRCANDPQRTSPVLETSHSRHHSIGTLFLLPSALRSRLIARRDPSLDEEGLPAYRFDVILRGDGETPFFLDY
jgi:hypothetical protein